MSIYTYDNLMLNGRLGNQLWQVAATIGLAHRAGGSARFNPNWEYRQFFSVPDRFFQPYSGATIDGGTNYFQEFHYFEDIKSEIRNFFSFSRKAIEGTWDRYGEILERLENGVAIHVRRGDYLKYPKHFPIMSPRYFKGAMSNVGLECPILVFSDDIEWCRQNEKYLSIEGRDVTFIDGVVRPVEVKDRVGEPEDIYDLVLMTKCEDHIISNSTFSWWGAWLSNNTRPMYPSRWFGPAVPGGERWELAIPEGWRKIEC